MMRSQRVSYLRLFMAAASSFFGNPLGVVESRGQYQSHTRRGPGRRAYRGNRTNREYPNACLHGGKWLKSGVRGH